MLNIYWIRHAESMMQLLSQTHICGQFPETPLTSKGEAQAHELGKRLLRDGFRFDEVYVSPTIRTYRTAEIALAYVDFPVENIIKTPKIHELGKGIWDGKERQALFDAIPDVHEKVRYDSLNFALPGGESQLQVAKRMREFAEDRAAVTKMAIIPSERFRTALRLRFIFGHCSALINSK